MQKNMWRKGNIERLQNLVTSASKHIHAVQLKFDSWIPTDIISNGAFPSAACKMSSFTRVAHSSLKTSAQMFFNNLM